MIRNNSKKFISSRTIIEHKNQKQIQYLKVATSPTKLSYNKELTNHTRSQIATMTTWAPPLLNGGTFNKPPKPFRSDEIKQLKLTRSSATAAEMPSQPDHQALLFKCFTRSADGYQNLWGFLLDLFQRMSKVSDPRS